MVGAGFIIEGYGSGTMTCPFCYGRGHRIGIATTTAAECKACLGRGEIDYKAIERVRPSRAGTGE